VLTRNSFKREFPMHLMLLPGVIFTLIFAYGPMFGVIMAFQKYVPAMGFLKSVWVGLDNFRYVLSIPDIYLVIRNTLSIAIMKIVFGTLATIITALLLNEVVSKRFRRSVQTIIYMPSFLSWVILGGILRDILSIDGVVNNALNRFGIAPILFLGNNTLFPFVLVLSDMWQNVGMGTIIYLAAIANINPTLYEAAIVDGANRWKQALYITLPGMKPIIILLLTLSLGGILNAGFEQILVLYNPVVYSSGDVIDTWVYRAGLVDAQYSLASAVGLFKSVVSLVLISTSYYLAHKYGDYRIF